MLFLNKLRELPTLLQRKGRVARLRSFQFQFKDVDFALNKREFKEIEFWDVIGK